MTVKSKDSIEEVKTPAQVFLYVLLHPRTWFIFIVVLLIIIAAVTIRFKYEDGKLSVMKQGIPIPTQKK